MVIRTERVCLDFAVINALGPNQWAETALGEGTAAEAYDALKRRRKDTEARCEQEGLRFWPVVLEQQGGMTKAADAAFTAIAKAVATKEMSEFTKVKAELLHRLAVVLARSCAQRISRRMRRTVVGRGAWELSVRRATASISGPSALDEDVWQ